MLGNPIRVMGARARNPRLTVLGKGMDAVPSLGMTLCCGCAELEAVQRTLSRPTKREIDPAPAGHRMRPVPKRLNAVKRQARRATPHHNVAMLEPNAARPIVAPQTTEQ